jgi:exonuclease SbcD
MKLLITGDWHYTDKTPDCRIDDYQAALHDKIDQIFQISEEEDVDYILQAGDMTDTPFLSYSTFITFSNILHKNKKRKCTVYGQHDLRYRNKGNTPLDALADRGLVYIMDSEGETPICFPDITIYGCSFGEQHPKIKDPDKFNILILHQLILSTQERDWQKEQILHSALLKNSEFDLIVSGDNHKPFILSNEDINGNPHKLLVNCGSLMRSSIEQVDHEPFVVIFDLDEDLKPRKIFLKIKPWQEVFDLERKVKQEEINENLEAYAEGLKEQKDMGLDYKANLIAHMQANNVEKPIEDIVHKWTTM